METFPPLPYLAEVTPPVPQAAGSSVVGADRLAPAAAPADAVVEELLLLLLLLNWPLYLFLLLPLL